MSDGNLTVYVWCMYMSGFNGKVKDNRYVMTDMYSYLCISDARMYEYLEIIYTNVV